jgi:hypothetical protein
VELFFAKVSGVVFSIVQLVFSSISSTPSGGSPERRMGIVWGQPIELAVCLGNGERQDG